MNTTCILFLFPQCFPLFYLSANTASTISLTRVQAKRLIPYASSFSYSFPKDRRFPYLSRVRRKTYSFVINQGLRANGYTDSSLKKCLNKKTNPRQSQETSLGFAVSTYVEGASDRVGRVLRKFNIRPPFRPIRRLGHIFKKPKDHTYDRPSPRDKVQSELPWLFVHIRRGE